MLTVTQVSKSFGDLTAVNDLSFHVNRGEALGLVGQNGAGKSTTFKMLLNFLTPDTGTITFDGQPISESLLNRLGFLPEERGLYMDMTIKSRITNAKQASSHGPRCCFVFGRLRSGGHFPPERRLDVPLRSTHLRQQHLHLPLGDTPQILN